MPRDIHADLETHFGLPRTSYTYKLTITPRVGAVEGYTTLDRNFVSNAVTYYSNSNVLPATFPTTLALTKGAVDARILFNVARFSRAKVEAHFYDEAAYELAAVNYRGNLDQEVVLMGGRFGKADIDDSGAVIELLDWAAIANKPMGHETRQNCAVMRFARGYCYNDPALGGLGDGPNIEDAEHHRVAEIGTVTSAKQFTLTNIVGSTPADGWANNGVLRIVGGPNAGIEEVVKIWTGGTSKLVKLALPLPYVPVTGDDVVLEEGCGRSWADCIVKENTDNFFMGHPFIPLDAVQQKNKV